MANGVQLATAYISLNVRSDDIKKQVSSALNGVRGEGRQVGTSIGSRIAEGIRSHLGGGALGMSIFNPMEIAGVRWAVKAGRTIGTALRTAIVSSVSLGLGAAMLGVGAALTAGLDRLKTLQRAEVQLSLKLPPAEIDRVRKAVEAAVKGTPISLDSAMKAAPRLVNSGLNAQQIQQYVTDVANMSAATGGIADFERLDLILTQVRAKTKLTGEEMMQLIEAGVDVRGMLKQTFGWDDKTLEKNLKANKVGINELQKATQKLYGQNGGLSKKMGETFDGAVGNMKASIARLGANILDVIFGSAEGDDPLQGAVDGVTALTEKLDVAGKWVAENKTEIREAFTDIKDAVVGVGSAIGDVIGFLGRMKDTAVDVGNWFTRTWDNITAAVGRAGDKVKSVVDTVKTKFSDIIDDIKKKFDSIFGENGWFATQFKKLGELVDKVRDVLGLGPATANAGAVPFNAGPLAPGAFGNYPSRAGLAPGTRLDGSDQGLSVVPNGTAATRPGMYPGDQGLLGRVKPGTYVSEAGVGDLTKGIGDCTSSIEDLIALIEGKSTAGRSMATGNADEWLTKNGFVATDRPMPGTFQVGFFNDPNAPGGGHMQATLPGGTNFNWGDNASAANRGVGGSGAWGDPRFNKHYYKRYGVGGGVWGAGSATSDSIPAMLSNGEHVLTAADVKAMGGQQGVYAFRNALQAGLIPGFAPGGAVDPSVIQDAQDQAADLNNAAIVAQQRYNEVMNKGDATPAEIMAARQALGQAQRAAQQAAADLPIIASGGTPPDRSSQNRVFDLTDQLEMAQQQLADQQAAGDIPVSQQTASQYNVDSLTRERNQAIADLTGQGQSDYGGNFLRSLGFIPANAGNTGVAGTSSLASFIGMGNDVVGGLIDTGASLAQMAASAGIGAATMGASAAAGPAASAAASYGIQLAATTAKRVASYGFQMASIGADSLVEQLFPFGAPRWLGYDYTGFAPQIGIQEALTGTLEQMGGDAIRKHFAGQGNAVVPADPQAPTNTDPSGPSASAPQPAPATDQILQPGDPGFYTPPMQINPPFFDPNNPGGGGLGGGSGGGGSWARGGAVGIYDNGGVLKPGELAYNASRTPESILTKQQWNAMAANASTKSKDSAPLVQNLYAQDMQDAIRQLEKVKRRDMMQYAGRP